MPDVRISEAAILLGVSDDTVRRWIDHGTLPVSLDAAGRKVVDGAALAALAVEQAGGSGLERLESPAGTRSARNHLTGLVTRIVSDPVMSQVEVQCGAYRVVSLISTEAVRELGLEVGSVTTAIVKATNVSLERRP